jgi:ribosome-associated heat shock protein Hsp15
MNQFIPPFHPENQTDREAQNVRVDKWLWAARFFKTRALAIQGVESGKVLLNGERVKPAKNVNVGDTLTIRRGPYISTVIVKALSLRRGPAVEAQNLFEETPESITARQEVAERLSQEPSHGFAEGRPTKKDRRDLDRFRFNDE